MAQLNRRCIGPFTQILTMEALPLAGPLTDEGLRVIENAWIHITNGRIDAISAQPNDAPIEEVEEPAVAVPGLIDAHTHLCFAGDRAKDYALRLQGVSYQEIAKHGGGILDTVQSTRQASKSILIELIRSRLNTLLSRGVTTVEIKSGYGLNVEAEYKQLQAIQQASLEHPVSVIATCLAAHTVPPEFNAPDPYLESLTEQLLPKVLREALAQRVDIFIEKNAIPIRQAEDYLLSAKQLGFRICVHADQFTRGGAAVAARVGADSADHLEQTNEQDCKILREAGVSAIVLPGATLGLGMPFPKARLLLDQGLSLAIASDWNPGSAPMGDLLTQAALMGAQQKLSTAETWAALTYRAAHALRLTDRGILSKDRRADIALYPCSDYREIFYYQGAMQPKATWVEGERYYG